ncbi:MAG: DUF1788 domain-containing protein [Methanobrevibacter sp.]|jgi:hypothetical protein|nr:DUF1788 domain-containing protein [Candidatus Methanoflexus mossambicus]
MEFDEKLNRIQSVIKQDSFMKNTGLGNDIGFYIFDYDPKYELNVRGHIKFLKEKFNNSDLVSFKIVEFDLYDIIVEILNEKGYLEKIFNLEEEYGKDHVQKNINRLLKISNNDSLIIKHIMDNISKDSIVFITGVGKSYPIIRSHEILNNLHDKIDDIPIVLFFPGKYSGNELELFSTIKDNNYYRAFPLIE